LGNREPGINSGRLSVALLLGPGPSSLFSEALREQVTGLYGVEPAIEFLEVAEIVDNSAS
jgi:hypothetical protein